VEAIQENGALGLTLAAAADFEDVAVPTWASGPSESRSLYARQLAADSVVRGVARGRISGQNHPALAPLHESPPGRFLLPSEANAYLAAAAAIDPAWALDVACGLIETHTPDGLEESMYLTSRAAIRAGLADRVAAIARRPGFIVEQACWTHAAARSGAMEPDTVFALARELAPRVSDELDTDRELMAGLPLMMALACVGETELLSELAAEWRTPPPVLADYLFHRMAGSAAAKLRYEKRLDKLFTMTEDEWNLTYEYNFGWWLDAGSEEKRRLQACQYVLALTAELPWSVIPGSLANVNEFTQ
jgi:hypothetical protein